MGEDHRTPGQLIEELMKSRRWTQKTLGVVMGMEKTAISRVIAGARPVTAELAITLGELFGVPPQRFLDLQSAYDLAKAQLLFRPDPGRAVRAHLFSELPVAEMIKRRWLDAEDPHDVRSVEAALARFFGVQTTEEIEILPHAAKKTNVFGSATPEQIAWLQRVRTIASELMVARYHPDACKEAIAAMKDLRVSAEAIRKVPQILALTGIRFVIVESLTRAKIDGVCFWLDEGSPVIGMAMRFDRIDNFWFVLRHELEHVLRGHGKAAAMLDAELDGERGGQGEGVAEEERVANAAASEFCTPQKTLQQFIARKEPYFSKRDILALSRMVQVHPGLVAGQLQRRTGRYDLFREHQVKVRGIVSPGAAIDGWGDVYPMGT